MKDTSIVYTPEQMKVLNRLTVAMCMVSDSWKESPARRLTLINTHNYASLIKMIYYELEEIDIKEKEKKDVISR